MREVVLTGGPLDGQSKVVYGGLKVALGQEYGWTYSCGWPAYASGMYSPIGEWIEPERDKQEAYVCDVCERYGSHDILPSAG